MSRHPAISLDDRPDPVELRGDTDRPSRSELHRDDVEPADFDDARIAEKHGVQRGGFFAYENKVDHYGMEDW